MIISDPDMGYEDSEVGWYSQAWLGVEKLWGGDLWAETLVTRKSRCGGRAFHPEKQLMRRLWGRDKAPRTELSLFLKGIKLREAHVWQDGKGSDLGMRTPGWAESSLPFSHLTMGSWVPTAQSCGEACVSTKQVFTGAGPLSSMQCLWVLAQESLGLCFA